MRFGVAGIRALAVAVLVLSPIAATPASRQEPATSKPKLTLKGVPSVGFPSTVFVFQARLSGGRDDDEGLYCLTAEWIWEEQADSSLNESDCEPFKAGATPIDRTFSEEQSFSRLGTHVVRLVLHKGEREVASAATSVIVRKP